LLHQFSHLVIAIILHYNWALDDIIFELINCAIEYYIYFVGVTKKQYPLSFIQKKKKKKILTVLKLANKGEASEHDLFSSNKKKGLPKNGSCGAGKPSHEYKVFPVKKKKANEINPSYQFQNWKFNFQALNSVDLY
jgi:hypothetical protein